MLPGVGAERAPNFRDRSRDRKSLASQRSAGYDGRVNPSGTTGRAEDQDLAPWRAFLHAHARVARRLDEDLRIGHALSLQEYETLLHLAEAPGRPPD